MAVPGPMNAVVLDTNVALDLLVFNDPAARSLKQALEHAKVDWLVTEAMRAEFARVLAYPRMAARLQVLGLTGSDLLARYDHLSRTRPVAPQAAIRCSDRDDQMFIDLAVAHRARLLSKDRQVLRLKKRLFAFGIVVCHATDLAA